MRFAVCFLFTFFSIKYAEYVHKLRFMMSFIILLFLREIPGKLG